MLESLKKTKRPDKPIWAKNIVLRQKALGISSIEQLAELAELPYPTVRDIAAGTSEGGYEKREKIARALKCTVADLYRGAAEPGAPIPDVASAIDLLSKFASLPPTLQKMALTLIYQDTAYLAEIPPQVAKEMGAEMRRLFEPLSKAGQK